ncbi:hypothetical protein [Marinobacter xestospongiae]|uniref:hypothetical protein n=1 Tax=Marinobacter xestospongiae TaxID=994319 RepID=UPI002004EB7A|nr:hypothetical protein [Marinobacter xestospongiae]MCK7565461.1 hypothetical protein [Marinobacter xestospongiae]
MTQRQWTIAVFLALFAVGLLAVQSPDHAGGPVLTDLVVEWSLDADGRDPSPSDGPWLILCVVASVLLSSRVVPLTARGLRSPRRRLIHFPQLPQAPPARC